MAAGAVGTNQFGLDSNLYTRGTGDDKNRGESMVVRHLEKMQADKENLALEKMAALMPHLGTAVRVMALKESVFDVETALQVLRTFEAQNGDQLKALHKKRKKLKDEEAAAVQEAEEEAAAAAAASSEDSGSSSESSGDDSSSDDGSSDSDSRRRSKKRRRSRSRSRDRRSKKKSSSSSSKKKHRKDKDRSRRKEKERGSKDKKSKRSKESKPLTASENFGRFGIIRETDYTAKRGEFMLWATEVKKVNIEALGRADERELFKDFMEDYNTGTLPHRKYYNLEIYAREKAAKAAAKGLKHADKKAAKPTALDDEESLRRQREEERARLAAERMQQAYEELRATDKARDMREQEMLRLQMQAAYKTGDKKKADQIFKLLMTDEEKKAKGIIK